MPDASTEGSAERRVVAELTEEYAKISAGTVPADASSLLWIRQIEGRRQASGINYAQVGIVREAVIEFKHAVECDYLRQIAARFLNNSDKKPSVDEVMAIVNAITAEKFTTAELLLSEEDYVKLKTLYSIHPLATKI